MTTAHFSGHLVCIFPTLSVYFTLTTFRINSGYFPKSLYLVSSMAMQCEKCDVMSEIVYVIQMQFISTAALQTQN